MQVELEIKNFRCFPDSSPARITIQPGFTALVGANNAGKSSLLRFFYEFRPGFNYLSGPNGNFLGALHGQPQGVHPANGINEPEEVFNDGNGRDLEIVARFTPPHADVEPAAAPWPRRLTVTILRRDFSWIAGVEPGWSSAGSVAYSGNLLMYDPNAANQPVVDLSPVFTAFSTLGKTLYIGPFRNAINVGAGSHYDVHVGQAVIQTWNTWKTGPSRATNRAAIQLTEDLRRIFQFQSLEINPSSDQQTLQVIIDRRPYRLHEIGAGFTQFFLVLANAAIQKPAYILIDRVPRSV